MHQTAARDSGDLTKLSENLEFRGSSSATFETDLLWLSEIVPQTLTDRSHRFRSLFRRVRIAQAQGVLGRGMQAAGNARAAVVASPRRWPENSRLFSATIFLHPSERNSPVTPESI